MALTASDKAQIVKKYGRAKSDTGSSEVQIALLSARITYLTNHMKTNAHDFHTRYGLTRLVSQRRKLLRYFKDKNPARYQDLLKDLDIRG